LRFSEPQNQRFLEVIKILRILEPQTFLRKILEVDLKWQKWKVQQR
jgi:hypothetical protein